MIICSALYYSGSLARGDLIVRDNRFYSGKYSETFPVWWQYLRKHYPNEHVILFADTASPVPIQPLLDRWMNEPYDVGNPECSRSYSTDEDGPRVHVRWLSAHSGKYFWPMQRNLVEGIITAYRANDDLLWWDNDCYNATNIVPLLHGIDFAAPSIATHQQTADSVFTYMSAARLHALDPLGIDLPSFLTTMLNEGPIETRMHTLQEGGLYKLFAYGRTRQLGADIELSHLSCYDHFMAFLRRNPLDTPEWRELVARLASFDFSQIPDVELSFLDMDYPANATRKEAR